MNVQKRASRIALVVGQSEPSRSHRYEDDFVSALERRFETIILAPHHIERVVQDSISVLETVDAILIMRKLNELAGSNTIDWSGYKGRRIYIEFDAFHDFTSWGRNNGAVRDVFWRHQFDTLVCTGISSYQHFTGHGIPVVLMHKGFDKDRFFVTERSRSGLVFFGSPYRSRAAMLRVLSQRNIPFECERTSYIGLNEVMNGYLGLLTTVRGSRVSLGKLGRAVERVRPGTLLTYEAAPEPMAKHFEAAAAGLAVFTDYTADLDILGFRDGESAITFSTFSELADKCEYYLANPDLLYEIGKAASAICRESHTWDHRVASLEAALFSPYHQC